MPQLAALPRLDLEVTSRVERAPSELERALKSSELWLKRDDLAGQGYGGGKPRKLEFLFGKAKAEGAARVLTFGGVGSNHVVACAHYAARHQLGCEAFLLPQHPTVEVRRNLLAAQASGARLTMAGSKVVAEHRAARSARDEARGRAAVVPWGGTSPLGDVGFVAAAFELAEQVRAQALPAPKRIVMAGGTLGSAVGLARGLALAGLAQIEVLVVRASNWNTSSQGQLEARRRELDSWLEAQGIAAPTPAALVLSGSHLGRGYGFPTQEGREMQRLFAAAGVELELTYTAKAAGALDATSGPVLFWLSQNAHTLPQARVSGLPKQLRGYARGSRR